MIALAACHLQHIVTDGRSYRLPEALHTQLASRGLRQAVTHLKSVRDMDSVLTASMLLNCLAFCYADWRDDDVDIKRGRPSWQWLRIQMGLKDILIETKPFHADSIWLPMFIATNTFVITEPPSNDLDTRLAAYCGIDSTSTEANCPYFEFARLLSPLVTREPSVQYLGLYTNAIGGLDYRFVELLEREDSRAMVLFAHWLALMMCVDAWWLTRRTRRECWMMCRILDGRLVGRDRVLLVRSAGACGYEIDMNVHFGMLEDIQSCA